jgi:hypothetical protein
MHTRTNQRSRTVCGKRRRHRNLRARVSIPIALDVASLSFRAFIVMEAVYGAGRALLASPDILRAALA